ncbi:hypothetical protein [Pseudomonas cavernae]|uniref:hypothetical protein n=1 Tax=Pseudomonas cavernae TaxID=2320867 RepID=UPI001EE55AA9|nr:hypothetical protein [Pseudomonas cavernae]
MLTAHRAGDAAPRIASGLRLCAHSASENRALQQAIQALLHQHLCGSNSGVEVIALSRPTGEMPLNLLLRPIPSTTRPMTAPGGGGVHP